MSCVSSDINYSIYLDLYHTDGSWTYTYTLIFDAGTHDWQFLEDFIVPEKPVKTDLTIDPNSLTGDIENWGTKAGLLKKCPCKLFQLNPNYGPEEGDINVDIIMQLSEIEVKKSTNITFSIPEWDTPCYMINVWVVNQEFNQNSNCIGFTYKGPDPQIISVENGLINNCLCGSNNNFRKWLPL